MVMFSSMSFGFTRYIGSPEILAGTDLDPAQKYAGFCSLHFWRPHGHHVVGLLVSRTHAVPDLRAQETT